MKPKKTFFSEQLKKIMFEKHITQRELAKKLGCIQQRISFWTTGRTIPKIESVKKIAMALDMPINYFIEDSGYVASCDKTSLDEKDIKILRLEKEILNLKLQIEKMRNKQTLKIKK